MEEPTAKNLEDFFPKKGEDIDYIEDVHESVTMEVYCAKFFKQCEKEIGINALAPGVDQANTSLHPRKDLLESELCSPRKMRLGQLKVD